MQSAHGITGEVDFGRVEFRAFADIGQNFLEGVMEDRSIAGGVTGQEIAGGFHEVRVVDTVQDQNRITAVIKIFRESPELSGPVMPAHARQQDRQRGIGLFFGGPQVVPQPRTVFPEPDGPA